VTAAYGGHYFSAKQATWIDALRGTLPTRGQSRQVALAALIRAASFCAASPGHTAQPFQPTKTARRFLREAWCKDIVQKTKHELDSLCSAKANKQGVAIKKDANLVAKKTRRTDLVFIDPPYSGVHYSRFYHVLETIACGKAGEVCGIGRYPHESKRPRSRYSLRSQSGAALDELLAIIAARGSRVILTFPDHKCSNGLSGSLVARIAARHFTIRKSSVASRFSSLGGTSGNRDNEGGRDARRDARELVLQLVPRAP
jgi:adenine-specific DNA-methyltransferase